MWPQTLCVRKINQKKHPELIRLKMLVFWVNLLYLMVAIQASNETTTTSQAPLTTIAATSIVASLNTTLQPLNDTETTKMELNATTTVETTIMPSMNDSTTTTAIPETTNGTIKEMTTTTTPPHMVTTNNSIESSDPPISSTTSTTTTTTTISSTTTTSVPMTTTAVTTTTEDFGIKDTIIATLKAQVVVLTQENHGLIAQITELRESQGTMHELQYQHTLANEGSNEQIQPGSHFQIETLIAENDRLQTKNDLLTQTISELHEQISLMIEKLEKSEKVARIDGNNSVNQNDSMIESPKNKQKKQKSNAGIDSEDMQPPVIMHGNENSGGFISSHAQQTQQSKSNTISLTSNKESQSEHNAEIKKYNDRFVFAVGLFVWV